MSIRDFLRDQDLLEQLCHREWLRGDQRYVGISEYNGVVNIIWENIYCDLGSASYKIPLDEFEKLWKEMKDLDNFERQIITSTIVDTVDMYINQQENE